MDGVLNKYESFAVENIFVCTSSNAKNNGFTPKGSLIAINSVPSVLQMTKLYSPSIYFSISRP